jgi:hypothetical protein
MPALPNPQLESFCIHIAAGVNQSEAARRAGYSDLSAANMGCRIAKREDVRMRIMELADSEDPTRGTVGKKVWIVSEAIDLYRDSRKAEEFNAARLCLEFLARMQGLLVDKRETDSRQLKINITNATELREVLRANVEQLPAEVRAELEGEVLDVSRGT